MYPQQFLHDLLDAFMVRDMDDEIPLRDLGLFSKIILDVEQTYISIDDVWRYLNREDLGIPCENGLKRCAILLTSRDRDVFNKMDK